MSKKWITILVAAVIGALLLPSAAVATCVVSIATTGVSYTDSTPNPPVTGKDPVPFTAGDKISLVALNAPSGAALTVNKEGVAERVADLLITDDGSGVNFCFTAGADLVVTYNAIMTSPTTPGNLSIPGNLDIFDSNGIGGLTVTSATVTQVFAANTTNSQIDIKVGQAGTPGNLLVGNGSALRVKNIRVNAQNAGATISATFLGGTFNVGAGVPTIDKTAVGTVPTAPTTDATFAAAFTLVTPKAPQSATDNGGGTQSSNAGLALPNFVKMTEGFSNALRTAGGTCNSPTQQSDTCASGIANDIATVATSLTFSVTGIPSGVTVTFPSSMSTSAVANSADSLTFAAKSTTLTNSGAPGALTVTYNTTKNGTSSNAMVVETADNADGGTKAGASSSNPNCKSDGSPLTNGSLCDANPKIGVKVGSTSAAGSAKLWWVFGPADVGSNLFQGDDVAADTTVIPRYKGEDPNTNPNRIIINNAKFFQIFPTRTTLLFPFVSSQGGWNSGIEIANTGADTGVFTAATSGQLGGITFFFFGTNPLTGATVTDSVNSDTTSGGTDISSACRGLDATGRVAAGKTAACVLTSLLTKLPTAPTAFDGYVIAVTGFNFAHGFSVVFNAGGQPFSSSNALVLGSNGVQTRPTGGESLDQ